MEPEPGTLQARFIGLLEELDRRGITDKFSSRPPELFLLDFLDSQDAEILKLREFYDAQEAADEEISDFSLQRAAVDRLEQARAAVESSTSTVELLTEAEHHVVDLLGDAAVAFKEVIGMPSNERLAYPYDWTEFVDKIHQLQYMVMAQAAARAYPSRYRGLASE